MAYANSGIAKEERALLEALGARLGVEGERLEELVRATCTRIESTVIAPTTQGGMADQKPQDEPSSGR